MVVVQDDKFRLVELIWGAQGSLRYARKCCIYTLGVQAELGLEMVTGRG